MNVTHPFAATLEKMRKNRDEKTGAGYASLTDQEKREWHADVYAFRRVMRGVPNHEATSPCDPEGEWFDPARIQIAERYYRTKYGIKNRRQLEPDPQA